MAKAKCQKEEQKIAKGSSKNKMANIQFWNKQKRMRDNDKQMKKKKKKKEKTKYYFRAKEIGTQREEQTKSWVHEVREKERDCDCDWY